jgi:hypothetical protein
VIEMKIPTCLILFFLIIFCGASSYAQNKVVVIPLQEELDEKSLRALCRGYDFIGEKPPHEFNCPPKLVFVTSEAYNGYLGGVSGADNYCQYHANQSEITKGRVFKAWISDGKLSPDLRFVHSQTPYILTCQLGPNSRVGVLPYLLAIQKKDALA